jgi:hypothetical protein
MNILEERMDVFNKLHTQLTFENKPKFKIGDHVFNKNDIKEYILNEKYDNYQPWVDYGIIVEVKMKMVTGQYDDRRNIEYNEESEQIIWSDPDWEYTILLRYGLLKYNKHYDDIYLDIIKYEKFKENEIEFLFKLNDFIDECNMDKIDRIKQEKIEKDERLTLRMNKIEKHFLINKKSDDDE